MNKMKRPSNDQYDELRKKAELLVKNKTAADEDPLRDDVGKIIHDLKVHQVELEMQNNELMRIQEDLARSSERYFKLFNRAPVGYASVDRFGMIRQSNQSLSKMLGMEYWKLNQRPLTNFVHEEDRPLFLTRLKLFSEKSRGDSFEIRMKDTAGKLIHAQLAVQSIETRAREKDGDKSILVVVSDITQKKIAEKALRDHKDLLNSIVEDIPAMICRFDQKGGISYVNLEYCEFYGSDEAKCLSRNFYDTIPGRMREQVKLQLQKLTPDSPTTSYELEAAAGSGEARWQRWVIRAIYDEAAEIRFYQAVGYDTTEQHQILQEKKEKEKLAGIVELAGAVCHELRQPLQVILGLADLVSMKMPGDNVLEKDLNTLKKEINRINMSLHQMDNISRYETKKYVGDSKIIDLNNSSDRRRDIRYQPDQSVFVHFFANKHIKVRLIDISKGGLSFWGIGLNLDHLDDFSCDILDESEDTVIKCLPCLLIPDDSVNEYSLHRNRQGRPHRAKFVSLNRDQIAQIETFIAGFQSRLL